MSIRTNSILKIEINYDVKSALVDEKQTILSNNLLKFLGSKAKGRLSTPAKVQFKAQNA